MSEILILQGDARKIPLADGVVQCVVTSPPYWGLRKYAGAQDLIWTRPELTRPFGIDPKDYALAEAVLACELDGHEWAEETRAGISGGVHDATSDEPNKYEPNRFVPATTHGTCGRCGAWRGGYGLEPSIEMYLAHTVEILKEIRRVLRPDGVVFWNIGDSYAACRGNTYGKPGRDNKNLEAPTVVGHSKLAGENLKPKDLCLIPERVAIAAQADGWWVRSMIIWAKPNPMPESCKDRPTDAYEHIIMLTKSEKYFWDAAAVREPSTGNTHSRGNGDGGPKQREREAEDNHVGWPDGTREILAARNLRNVWTFPTQPYKGSHFATFPEEIPRRCILAASSERGACGRCGAPWQRMLGEVKTSGKSWNGDDLKSQGVNRNEQPDYAGEKFYENYTHAVTVGWEATCLCNIHATKPCVVLDPFGGSGTTARVAVELNRHAVSLDLAYHEHAERRTRHVQRRLVQA